MISKRNQPMHNMWTKLLARRKKASANSLYYSMKAINWKKMLQGLVTTNEAVCFLTQKYCTKLCLEQYHYAQGLHSEDFLMVTSFHIYAPEPEGELVTLIVTASEHNTYIFVRTGAGHLQIFRAEAQSHYRLL